MKNKKGFTLIEMMIVIMLLSVVAATILPSQDDKIKQARYEQDVKTMQDLKQMFADYRADIGANPAAVVIDGVPTLECLRDSSYFEAVDKYRDGYTDLQGREWTCVAGHEEGGYDARRLDQTDGHIKNAYGEYYRLYDINGNLIIGDEYGHGTEIFYIESLGADGEVEGELYDKDHRLKVGADIPDLIVRAVSELPEDTIYKNAIIIIPQPAGYGMDDFETGQVRVICSQVLEIDAWEASPGYDFKEFYHYDVNELPRYGNNIPVVIHIFPDGGMDDASILGAVEYIESVQEINELTVTLRENDIVP